MLVVRSSDSRRVPSCPQLEPQCLHDNEAHNLLMTKMAHNDDSREASAWIAARQVWLEASLSALLEYRKEGWVRTGCDRFSECVLSATVRKGARDKSLYFRDALGQILPKTPCSVLATLTFPFWENRALKSDRTPVRTHSLRTNPCGTQVPSYQ